MFEDSFPRQRMTLSYYENDANGNPTVHVERSLYGESAQMLGPILNELTYFLQGIGFTYVAGLTTFDDDGDEGHSSTTI